MIIYDYSKASFSDMVEWFKTPEGRKGLSILNDNNRKHGNRILNGKEMAKSFFRSMQDEKLALAILKGYYSECSVRFNSDNHFSFRLYEEDKGERIDFNDPMFKPDIGLGNFEKGSWQIFAEIEVKTMHLRNNETIDCKTILSKIKNIRNLHKADALMLIINKDGMGYDHEPCAAMLISLDCCSNNYQFIYKKGEKEFDEAFEFINYQIIPDEPKGKSIDDVIEQLRIMYPNLEIHKGSDEL